MIFGGILLAIISVTGILSVCGYAIWKLRKWNPTVTVVVDKSKESEAVSALVNMLEEERAEKEREVRDNELRRYAESKKKREPLEMHVGGADDGILKTKNPHGKNILIPMKMTRDDREVLKAFYDL